MGFGAMSNYANERLKKYKRITLTVMVLTLINIMFIVLNKPCYLYQAISIIAYGYLCYEFCAKRIIIYPALIILLFVSIFIQICLLI